MRSRGGNKSKIKIVLTAETSADTADLESQRTKAASLFPHYVTSTCRVWPFQLWLVPHNTLARQPATDDRCGRDCSRFITHKPFQPMGFVYRHSQHQDKYCILCVPTPSCCAAQLLALPPEAGSRLHRQGTRYFSFPLSKSLAYLTWLAGLLRGQETELGPLRYPQYHSPSFPELRAMGSKSFLLLGFRLAKSSICHIQSITSLTFFNLFFCVNTTFWSKIVSILTTSQTNCQYIPWVSLSDTQLCLPETMRVSSVAI